MENKAVKGGNSGKRWRLNVFDIVIIVIALAAAALILNSRRSGGGLISSGAQEKVRYTIILEDMYVNAEGLIKKGDALVDKVEKRAIGSVADFEVVPYRASRLDETTGDYRIVEAPGRWSAVIVVEAYATVSGNLISVDGYAIRAGIEVSVLGPLYSGKGYITDIERDGELGA